MSYVLRVKDLRKCFIHIYVNFCKILLALNKITFFSISKSCVREVGEMINSFDFLNRMYCMQTLTNVRSTQIKYIIQFKNLYNYVNDL